YYGEADSLLANYAWYQAVGENHSWPVGRLKPNDWGLFDMHGNVIEWCYDAFTEDLSSPENGSKFTPKTGAIPETETRLLRGGSYYLDSSSVRSAYRYSSQPTDRIFTYGLRPVRTLGLRP
ncbi:MAG: SUMF1/EgtB/PvdO family nonheme iron enzyme, partial [Planctomycetaceae bacterium]|nr:SUMF1/EgtB/PvdO family nonheme iron enzyme [Planctomycetaceae bacterium]